MGLLKELLSNSSKSISFSETMFDVENSIGEMNEAVFVSLHMKECPIHTVLISKSIKYHLFQDPESRIFVVAMDSKHARRLICIVHNACSVKTTVHVYSFHIGPPTWN